MIRLDITNDGTGQLQLNRGNYNIELSMPSETEIGLTVIRTRVEHFNREEKVYALLRKAIDALEERGVTPR